MMVPLNVRDICQTASGGSHVTWYEATLTFTPGPGVVVSVEEGALAPHADNEMVSLALGAIERGALRALEGTGWGALIDIAKVVLHPVDFKPRMYEELTRREVAARLAALTPPQ